MLIGRFIPLTSARYKTIAEAAKTLDKIFSLKPESWFGIWILLIAGQSAYYNQLDRYYFWDFSHWLRGSILLVLMTILYSYLRKFLSIRKFQFNQLNASSLGFHFLLVVILFTLGFGSISSTGSIFMFPYLLAYFSIYMIYAIKLVGVTDDAGKIIEIESQSQKRNYAIISALLMATAMSLGYIFDDPLISTAGMVTLPFLILVIFGKHKRHIQRASFYPIFIFCAFLCAREGWFLIPSLALFYFIRYYNFFRNGIVYPTFGVDFD